MKSRSVFFLLPAAAALLVLSACGNKGPLVMPQKPVPIEEQPAEPATDAATDDVQDADDAAVPAEDDGDE